MIAMLSKRRHQCAIIPNRSILFPGKALKHFKTASSKLSQDRTSVMQLIGRGYQPRRRIRILEALDVSAFSFQPRWLWRFIGIRAAVNDSGDAFAKSFSNVVQSFLATAIFHRVVKKRADRFGFIRAVLKRDSSDTQNMCDVRNPGFLAHLISMRLGRVNQRFLKFVRQLHLTERSAD